MSRINKVLLLGGIVGVLITGTLIYGRLTAGKEAIFRVTETIQAGKTIAELQQANVLEKVMVSKLDVPADAIKNITDEMEQQSINYDLAKGAWLQKEHLNPEKHLFVSPGHQLLTVKVDNFIGVTPELSTTERLNLFATVTGADKLKRVELIAQSIPVAKVHKKNEALTAITLDCRNQEEAEKIASVLLASGNKYWFTIDSVKNLNPNSMSDAAKPNDTKPTETKKPFDLN